MKTLLKFAGNRHSQNGDDGVLAEIFRRLGIKKGWFVEFGAWDGKHLSNTLALLEDGWSGVDIEGDPEKYRDLLKTAQEFEGKLYTLQAYVSTKGHNSLDQLLKRSPLPQEFELLSIDIDSYDWWIWKSLRNYNPKVVIIEINSNFPVGEEYVQNPDEQGIGASFTSMVKLGHQKGYELVCHTGNTIFVRKDLVPILKLPEEELENPGSLFIEKWSQRKSLRQRLIRRIN